MASNLSFATAVASSRRHSEDRAAVFQRDESLVIVVADGAGGVRGGAIASKAAVDAVGARLASDPSDLYDVGVWSHVLSTVDADLARSPTGGETTAIIVIVGRHGLVGVSTGDSEAWLVSRCVDRLTEKQDRARLGMGRLRSTSFHRRALDGILIVATDGLFKAARGDSIVACCIGDSVTDTANRLVDLPRLPSGTYPDDVAVVVVAELLDQP